MKRAFLPVIVVVLLSLVACNTSVPDEISEPDEPESGEILLSEKQRVVLPDVNETDLATLVDGNSAFACDLYQLLRQTDGNVFYSPYSISLALAMTYAGARGETEQQMADTLHFILPQDRLHPAFNSLDIELSQRGEGAEGEDGEGFRLNIVNAIWGQKDYQFLPTFLDILAENYGAGLRILDFVKEPEDSRITINDWVSSQTEGRIEELIEKGLINASTRLVLTNAIYFNAAWQYPFEEDRTCDGSFYLLSGDKVTIPMMTQMESFGYTEGDGYQAVELPYDGDELSMVVLLPEAGKLEMFESSLDAQQMVTIVEALEPRQIALAMPQFEFESYYSLKEALTHMGMPAAFSAGADFSGMTDNGGLCIGDVVHKTFLSVDEAGTEAAAATAVFMNVIGIPETPITAVTINRPFILVIRDIKTGTILFVGRVIDPSE
jgi:serpin B